MPVPDFSPGEVLTAAAMDQVGLWLIETKDVTTAGTIDFTNKFSSSYANYLLMWSYLQNTSDASLFLQFRDSGGVLSTGYRHGYGGNYTSSGTPLFQGFSFQTTDTTSSFVGSSGSAGNRSSGYLQIMNPAASAICFANGQSATLSVSATLANTYLSGGIVHNVATARTGIRLFPAAGTVTGKFSLYGYRN